jgi:anti-sigma-K factor RskA
MDENALHELTAPYALDALDAQEREAYEAHLAQCGRCRDELASLSDAAVSLAYATASSAPPAELRERILESARAERVNVVPLRRRGAFRAVSALAAAAVAAAVALGVWAASLSHRLDQRSSALTAERQALALIAEPGARRIALHGRAGTLVVGADGRAALAVRRLPAAPRGKTYELWVIAGGSPQPAGFLRGGGDVSAAVLRLRVPPSATVAATVEPAGGSQAPTTTPFMSART